MTHTFTTISDVGQDHQLVLNLPADMPVGPVRVTVTRESESATKIRTFGDLIDSGVVGMHADRADLPTTDEEFRQWRHEAWAGKDE